MNSAKVIDPPMVFGNIGFHHIHQLLKEGELLLGGNAAASSALGGWIWVHLHKVKQAFQTVQISIGQTTDFVDCPPAALIMGRSARRI
jgi:hypothetical protein